MMIDHNIVRYALDFAVKTGATSVTIDIDEGVFTMPPSEAEELFAGLAPGEGFGVVNISFDEEG